MRSAVIRMWLIVAAAAVLASASATRVAVVTGATKGIGLGIARGLGEQGYRVHITGRTVSGPGSLESAAAAVQAAGGAAVTHAVDHADTAAVQALFERIFKTENNGVDLLVNNVYPGVSGLGDAVRKNATKFWMLSPSAFAEMNDASLTTHYVASTLYAKQMVPRRRGLIVMVSSPGGLFYFFTAAYSTGKAALDRMTTDFAHEVRRRTHSYVLVLPSATNTLCVSLSLATAPRHWRGLRGALPWAGGDREVRGVCRRRSAPAPALTVTLTRTLTLTLTRTRTRTLTCTRTLTLARIINARCGQRSARDESRVCSS